MNYYNKVVSQFSSPPPENVENIESQVKVDNMLTRNVQQVSYAICKFINPFVKCLL